MNLDLSVIVASYKRCDALELCLDDLARQVTPRSFEVILVLQAYPEGASDRLRKKFEGVMDVQVAEFPEGLGTSRARNTRAMPPVPATRSSANRPPTSDCIASRYRARGPTVTRRSAGRS
jgi:GT2 family glycosyltransferase